MSQQDSNETEGKTSWKPELHFVWDLVLDGLLSEKAQLEGSFPNFFRVAIDGTCAVQRKHCFLNTCRIPLLDKFFASTKVLGLSDLPESVTSSLARGPAHGVHEELHAELDKPSLKKRSPSS